MSQLAIVLGTVAALVVAGACGNTPRAGSAQRTDTLHLHGPNILVTPSRSKRFVESGRVKTVGMQMRYGPAPGDTAPPTHTTCTLAEDTVSAGLARRHYVVIVVERDTVTCEAVLAFGHDTGRAPARSTIDLADSAVHRAR